MKRNFLLAALAGMFASDPRVLNAPMTGPVGRRHRSRTRPSSGVFGDKLMKPHRALMRDGYQGREHASSRSRSEWMTT